MADPMTMSRLNFNSHAHVERDACGSPITKSRLYFNSHAHVERDNMIFEKVNFLRISTHTLTWSVTLLKLRALNHSIHFNSHAHVERDPICSWVSGGSKISTHTLTWSVTQC